MKADILERSPTETPQALSASSDRAFGTRPPSFDIAMGAVVLAVYGLIAILYPHFRLHLRMDNAWEEILPSVEVTAFLIPLLAFYVWRRERRACGLLRIALWAHLAFSALVLPIYIPLRSSTRLVDPFLARADHFIGFDQHTFVTWVVAVPAVNHFFWFMYTTLIALCGLTVVVLPFIGRLERAQNLLIAIILSFAITLVIEYFFAGIGPWETGGIVTDNSQRAVGQVIRHLKTDADFVVDLAKSEPLITIPSWHTILAVLCALAMRPVRILGPLAVLWSTLIVISTLTTGWHYLVDVLAGLAVAFGTHFFVQRFILPRVADRVPVPPLVIRGLFRPLESKATRNED